MYAAWSARQHNAARPDGKNAGGEADKVNDQRRNNTGQRVTPGVRKRRRRWHEIDDDDDDVDDDDSDEDDDDDDDE